MEPVKITVTKDWSSIDIYLFSNGQQYSPPRKYHLRSEELQWWGPTISYLARTQYGAGHSSIELYTLDGVKINGPLELFNEAAYVAVVPPDSFINTGYKEYLVRASRSWEKRLAQKTFNTEISNPGREGGKITTDQSHIEENNILNIPEKNAETASFESRTDTISSLIKTRPTKPPQRLQRKSIVNSKQIQKNKSFDTHNTMLKRICVDTDKVMPCSKPQQRINECVNRKLSHVVPKKINKILESTYRKKRGSIKPEYNIEDYRKINNESDKTYPLYNNELNINSSPDKELTVTDIYNNKESDITSLKNDPVFYLNSAIEESLHNQVQNNVTYDKGREQNQCPHCNENNSNQTFKEQLNNVIQIKECEQNNIILKQSVPNNDIETVSIENIPETAYINKKESHNDATVLNPTLIPEKHVTDEYIAYMNKGGILLLKLKIKLKDCKRIFNRDKCKSVPIASSLSNLPETEKTSQVDININFSGELLKSNIEQNIQSKSLQSLVNKLYNEEASHIISEKPRIIIIQCACRDYSDNHKQYMCEPHDCEVGSTKSEEKYYNQKLNKTVTSCSCHNKPVMIPNDINTLNGDMKPQTARDADDDRPSVSNGTRVKHLAQKFEMKSNKDTCRNENQRQSMLLSRLLGSSIEDDIEHKTRDVNNNPKPLLNKSTQTDWSNILLEARRHQDDSYSFHLPSLYILKQYNM